MDDFARGVESVGVVTALGVLFGIAVVLLFKIARGIDNWWLCRQFRKKSGR